MKVPDNPDFYYMSVIHTMHLEKENWNKSLEFISDPDPSMPLTQAVYYGFKKESDLLYFKLAVVQNEKSQ